MRRVRHVRMAVAAGAVTHIWGNPLKEARREVRSKLPFSLICSRTSSSSAWFLSAALDHALRGVLKAEVGISRLVGKKHPS